MKFSNVATSSWFTKMHFAGLSRYGWYASAVSVCTHTLTCNIHSHTTYMHNIQACIHTLPKNICTQTLANNTTHTPNTLTHTLHTIQTQTFPHKPHTCAQTPTQATGSSHRATLSTDAWMPCWLVCQCKLIECTCTHTIGPQTWTPPKSNR